MISRYRLDACSFLMRDRKTVNLEGRGVGEKLGEVDREDFIIRMNLIRDKYF